MVRAMEKASGREVRSDLQPAGPQAQSQLLPRAPLHPPKPSMPLQPLCLCLAAAGTRSLSSWGSAGSPLLRARSPQPPWCCSPCRSSTRSRAGGRETWPPATPTRRWPSGSWAGKLPLAWTRCVRDSPSSAGPVPPPAPLLSQPSLLSPCCRRGLVAVAAAESHGLQQELSRGPRARPAPVGCSGQPCLLPPPRGPSMAAIILGTLPAPPPASDMGQEARSIPSLSAPPLLILVPAGPLHLTEQKHKEEQSQGPALAPRA